MRLGEIINLKWSSVDMNRGIILVENNHSLTTKNKRNRVIPFNQSVTKVLTGIIRENELDLVFLRNGRQHNPDEVARKFKTYVIQLGFEKKLHFHHLRHSFCSQLAL
jgi:integrase